VEISALNQPQLQETWRQVRGTWISEVWKIHPTGGLGRLGTRLGPPQAIIGEAVSQVAQGDFRAELWRRAAPVDKSPFASRRGSRCGPQQKDRRRGGRDRPYPMFAVCSKLVKPPSALTLPRGLSNQFDRYAQIAVVAKRCSERVKSTPSRP
jgi:hypothetical protein